MLVIIVRVIIDCSCKYIYINIIDVHQQLICCSYYFTINTVFQVLCIYYLLLARLGTLVFFLVFFFIVIVLPGSIGVLSGYIFF